MKETFNCNHCNRKVEWYKSTLQEVGFYSVDEKIYCDDCLKRLAHYGVDI